MGLGPIKSHLSAKIKKVRDFFQLYTTGLSRREVERLLKKDALSALTYYKDKTTLKDSPPGKKSFGSRVRAFKEIFSSFVMQLTPARRLFYGISFAGFFIGLISARDLWVLGAFIILNLLMALELADKLTTRDELEIAREIQVSLEPEQLPEFHFSTSSGAMAIRCWALSVTWPEKASPQHCMPPIFRACLNPCRRKAPRRPIS
jgi:hypothetical protein